MLKKGAHPKTPLGKWCSGLSGRRVSKEGAVQQAAGAGTGHPGRLQGLHLGCWVLPRPGGQAPAWFALADAR